MVAFDTVATVGYGTAKTSMTPPNGWTVDDVARKRALKNVINLAYGMPSPKEMAQMSWEVDGTQTQPEDWADSEKYDRPWEREEAARLEANQREWMTEWEKLTTEEKLAKAAEGLDVMRGPDFAAPVEAEIGEFDDLGFDPDFGDDAAELEPVEVEPEPVADEPQPKRTKAMNYKDFTNAVMAQDANKDEITLARFVRDLLNKDWNCFQSDNQVRDAIYKHTGKITVWPPKSGKAAHEGYKLAWERCDALDATK
jgi:hypothetical protein